MHVALVTKKKNSPYFLELQEQKRMEGDTFKHPEAANALVNIGQRIHREHLHSFPALRLELFFSFLYDLAKLLQLLDET
jgi:hypothetical protein